MSRVVTGRPKSWPRAAAGLGVEEIGAQGWSLLTDFATPICSLSDSAVAHNLAEVRRWCDASGVALAPHGKTTMSPDLIARQLAAGAWGITAATPWQAGLLADWGVPRVLLANVCADPRPLAELLDRPVEITTFVDSVESVRLTAQACRGGVGRPLPVLIEVGSPGGRCGVRDIATGLEVAAAIAAEPALRLVGVAAFEGTRTGRGAAAVGEVRTLIATVRELAERLITTRAVPDDEPLLVSAGGSMYPDLVLAGLAGDYGHPVRILVRSGCSIVHDHGLYADSAPVTPKLRGALRVWSRVLSVPEPGWAIIDAGKRDLTVDPPARVLAVHRPPAAGVPGTGLVITHHNDQHGYVRCESGELRVGDILELGISHPCLTFDRWSHIPVIDDRRMVVGVVQTFF